MIMHTKVGYASTIVFLEVCDITRPCDGTHSTWAWIELN